MTRVLIIGNGQLARELIRTRPESIEASLVSRTELDITESAACKAVVEDCKPDFVINAAAYTAVDKAESEIDQAYLVNEQGSSNLAVACKAVGARLFHVSTDFVFDGRSNQPYSPESKTNPQGVYGASKLAGEKVVLDSSVDSVIVRTAWLYSEHGNNFVKTMLRLMQEKSQLGVVIDQVGTPTWARGLALTLWAGVERNVAGGIYHWSDAGVASWYDFAVAIQDIGLELGLLSEAIPVNAIPSGGYPTSAKRPAYSVLDKSKALEAFGVESAHWRRQLRLMMENLEVPDRVV